MTDLLRMTHPHLQRVHPFVASFIFLSGRALLAHANLMGRGGDYEELQVHISALWDMQGLGHSLAILPRILEISMRDQEHNMYEKGS